jgi:hypothetical protein
LRKRGSFSAGHAEAGGLDHQLEVLGTARGLEGLLVVDPVLFDQLQEDLVEGQHPVVFTLRNSLLDLGRLGGVHDEVLYAPGPHHHLADHCAAAVCRPDEPLPDDTFECAGEHRPDLSPLVWREQVYHAVYGLGSLHTQDAPQTVDRIMDVFPPHQQHQVRAQLANALQGIITQTLIPRKDGSGRVVACEVLVPTPGVRNLIQEAKNHQIYSAMQTGGKFGMQTMDSALLELVRRGLISQQEAEKRSSSSEELRRLAGGTSIGTNAGGYAAMKR